MRAQKFEQRAFLGREGGQPGGVKTLRPRLARGMAVHQQRQPVEARSAQFFGRGIV
jgi:hypothetical protein